MSRTTSSVIVLALFLTSIFALAFDIQPVRASGTIYIRADGSIDPPDAPISTSDNVTYTLTGNINSGGAPYGISLERNNIMVEGEGHVLESNGGGKGISLVGRSGVTIRNTTIQQFFYCIYLSGSSGNTISTNRITNSAYGILLDSSSSNNISENDITNNNFTGLWLRSSSDHNSIDRNTIANNSFGIWVSMSSGTSLIENTIANNNYVGMDLGFGSSTNNNVRGNTFIDNGLSARGSSSNSVENNTVNGRPLVYLEGAADFNVDDAGQVILVRCNRIRVENLNISRTDAGVELWETNSSTVSGNNIVNCRTGILLGSSSNNSIGGNTITNRNGGIDLYSSSNNDISENNIRDNGEGIGLHNSSNNNVSENDITANRWEGILLDSSSNNLICHNNFVGNAAQVATTVGYVNIWDDGYPSGGNYWSDYTGADKKCAANQDMPGSDGIGDAPYTIDGNNTDHYPLMAAWSSTPPIHVPEDYMSIQAAVDAATPWTTILIAPGTYNESIVVNKPLMIIGMLGSQPVFSGGGSGIAITLLAGASGSTVAGIVITNWDQGILVNNGSGCKIYNNIFSLINMDGIVLQGATAMNNRVYSNIFQQDSVAVDLTLSSQHNNVSRNIISLSTTAIKIETNQNTIYQNIISQNQLGINITNCSNNKIFHNTLADNTVQVSISNSAGNIWDDGYPLGGNYWSDHTGPDIFSGSNQDQPGSDGIVDTLYTVAIGSVDNYPLAGPFNAHEVGIIDYAVSRKVVGKGYALSLAVKIMNYGAYDENFFVTAYANVSAADAQAVTLVKSSSIILVLTWNTISFDYGNYTVNVQAEPVLNETNIADNDLCCGTVYVGIPGDVNGNGEVDIYDAIIVANSFMSTSGSRNWNANANINNDNMVDIYDAIILAGNYGKTA